MPVLFLLAFLWKIRFGNCNASGKFVFNALNKRNGIHDE